MSTVPFGKRTPLPSDLAKKLPSNIDAERSVLGAVFADRSIPNAAIQTARGILAPDDFSVEENRRIFRNMLFLSDAGIPIEALTIVENLRQNNELEKAGGAAYVSSLLDGMARITNVAYYATLVKEKSTLCNLIRFAHNLQEQAFEGSDSPQFLLQSAEVSIKNLTQTPTDNPAVVIGFQSLLTRECAPIEYAIDPLLSKRGTGEIYGWRGTGKSFISTNMAVDIAMGSESIWGGHRGGGGHWTISRPFRQLYVYGEMDESEIQARIRQIARMRGSDTPSDEQFGTICMDYQKHWRPKIATSRDRKFIEDRVFGGGYEGLWLDNLSTLWPASQETQSERDACLADWFTDLNQRGVWVIFLHHAGKSGEQRGGSEKEDMLSFVLKLRRPANYKPEEQLRIEVHIEKNRHKCLSTPMLMPFEIQLLRNQHGENVWVTRPAEAAQRAAAYEMFKTKMPTFLVGQEVGVSRATVYRWFKDYKENQNPDLEPEE